MSNPFIVNNGLISNNDTDMITEEESSNNAKNNGTQKTSFEISDYVDYELSARDIDDDLQDLVTKKKKNISKNDNNNSGGSSNNLQHYISILLDTINYHLQYVCYFFPILSSIITISIVSIFLWLFIGCIINPMEEYGVIDEYYNITSKLDLQMTQIKHYCLGGDSEDNICICDDPLIPISRNEHNSWIVAYHDNLKKLKLYSNEVPGGHTNISIESLSTIPKQQPDIVFLGESVIEEMDGRWMGVYNRTVGLQQLHQIFQKNFPQSSTSTSSSFGMNNSSSTSNTFSAVCLGIAGDTSPNVLWRLMHGEMPNDFHPKIWWLSLGMNDLTRTQCSENVVTIGILRIVEEILEKRPTAQIVINSLFPMTTLRGDMYPVISDVQDSFINKDENEKPDIEEEGDNNDDNERRYLIEISNGIDDYLRIYDTDEQDQDADDVKKSNLRLLAQIRDEIMAERNNNTITHSVLNSLKQIAEMEEIRRDDLAKHHDKKALMMDSILRNHQQLLKLKEETEQRKFKIGHLRKSKLPLWTSVKAINEQLRLFAEQNAKRVSYFDANDIFIERNRKNQYMLNTRLSSSKGHPTVEGFRKLEKEMIEFIRYQIINKVNSLKIEDMPIRDGTSDDAFFQYSVNTENFLHYVDDDEEPDSSVFNDDMDNIFMINDSNDDSNEDDW